MPRKAIRLSRASAVLVRHSGKIDRLVDNILSDNRRSDERREKILMTIANYIEGCEGVNWNFLDPWGFENEPEQRDWIARR